MRLLAIVVLGATWVGCGEQRDDDGELGGHCYPNASCNVGLACAAGICTPVDAALPDAEFLDAAADAPIDALVCTDSTLEPNDTIQAAFDTGVASVQSARTFASLMVCPA